MLLKAKKLIVTDLVRVSFLNGVATVIRMLTGLVSVKVVAALIGPSGIALLGQLNNFSAILLSISNGGINAGMTKYISEYSDSEKDYLVYLGTGFWITIVLSIITGIVLLLGAGYFSELILHDIGYKAVFYVFGFSIIFYALNALLVSVINGFKEYKKYVIANIMGSIVGLVFSVILALKFGIYGALISTVTFQSVVFFLTLAIIANRPWFNWRSFMGKFNANAAAKLGHFTLMALVSAITVPAGQLIVRNYITKYQSISEAGLWEGMNRISGMYLMVVTTSLSVYYLPKLAQLKTKGEIREEIYGVYKLIIPFLIVTTSAIFIFKSLIIKILFTKAFTGMQGLFAYQLIGDFLKISGWVLGYLLIAKAMTKVYIIMEFLNFFFLIIFSFFLVKKYGAIGATIGYAGVYLIYLIILCIVFRDILFKHDNSPKQQA